MKIAEKMRARKALGMTADEFNDYLVGKVEDADAEVFHTRRAGFINPTTANIDKTIQADRLYREALERAEYFGAC